MRREFVHNFGHVKNSKPAILREAYKRLTGDKSAASSLTEEVDARLAEMLEQEDRDIICDLCVNNPGFGHGYVIPSLPPVILEIFELNSWYKLVNSENHMWMHTTLRLCSGIRKNFPSNLENIVPSLAVTINTQKLESLDSQLLQPRVGRNFWLE